MRRPRPRSLLDPLADQFDVLARAGLPSAPLLRAGDLREEVCG
ncbi:MAG TPA: hypothetical protein VJS67_09995 [Pseudonocardiaceae bacterium]|nr:hypothetical protein [Pseudonocardiaceae bacterium]